MKIYKTIFVCALSVLLSACGGGIDIGGGSGGDVGAPTLEIVGVADSQIVLAWTPSPTNPGNTFVLNRDGVVIYTGPDIAYNDLGLTNGQDYCYTVSAVSANVATSAQRCATPMAGTVLSVTNKSLTADLSWIAVPGAISYNLYLAGTFIGSTPSISKNTDKANGDADDLLFATVVAPNTTYSWSGYYDRNGIWVSLSNWCVQYPVIIKAVDSFGNEGPASTQTAEPDTLGILDTTFGDNGFVNVVGATNGTFYGLAVLEDDTIVGLVDGDDSILVGYSEDVDALMTPLWDVWFEATMDTTRAMAIDADENIYVAGSDSDNAKVCRFIPDIGGYVLDAAGFGTGGCYEFVSLDNTRFNAIALDSQGRIVLGGQTGPLLGWETTMWRLLSDGSLDGTFLANGISFLIDGTDSWEYVSSVMMTFNQDDEEKILVTLKSRGFGGNFEGYYLFFQESGAVGGFLNRPTVTGGVADAVGLTDYNSLTLFYDTGGGFPGVYIQEIEVDPIKVNDTFFYEEASGNDEIANKIALDCHKRALVTGNATAAGDIMIFRTDESFGTDLGFATDGWYIFPNPAGTGGDGRVIAFDNLGRIVFGGTVDGAATTVPTLIRLQ